MGTTLKDINRRIGYGEKEKSDIKSLLSKLEAFMAEKADSNREYWRNELDRKRFKQQGARPVSWDVILRDINDYADLMLKATKDLQISIPDKYTIYTNYIAIDAPGGKNSRFEKGDVIDLFVVRMDNFSKNAFVALSSNLVTTEYSLTQSPEKIQCGSTHSFWFDDKHFANYLQRNWNAIYSNTLDRFYHIVEERVNELAQKRINLEKEIRHLELELEKKEEREER